VDQQTADRS